MRRQASLLLIAGASFLVWTTLDALAQDSANERRRPGALMPPTIVIPRTDVNEAFNELVLSFRQAQSPAQVKALAENKQLELTAIYITPGEFKGTHRVYDRKEAGLIISSAVADIKASFLKAREANRQRVQSMRNSTASPMLVQAYEEYSTKFDNVISDLDNGVNIIYGVAVKGNLASIRAKLRDRSDVDILEPVMVGGKMRLPHPTSLRN